VATEKALSAVTAEDLAFERSLQEMESHEPDIERAPSTTLRKERTQNVMLSEYLNVSPASNVNELLEQAHMAKSHGADSIEATPALIKSYTMASGYPTDVGYFFFQGIKVWIPGFSETHGYLDTQSIDAKVFGKSTIGISPIMDKRDKA
jgi:hypothetical protein